MELKPVAGVRCGEGEVPDPGERGHVQVQAGVQRLVRVPRSRRAEGTRTVPIYILCFQLNLFQMTF